MTISSIKTGSIGILPIFYRTNMKKMIIFSIHRNSTLITIHPETKRASRGSLALSLFAIVISRFLGPCFSKLRRERERE